MKKIFSIILVLILVLGTFVGCSSKGESVDKIKEALDKVVEEALKEEIIGDVSKDSKLLKLTVTQLPLDMIYNEERIVDEHILINSHKVTDYSAHLKMAGSITKNNILSTFSYHLAMVIEKGYTEQFNPIYYLG